MAGSYEPDHQAHIPSLEEVTGAYTDILAHNSRHTGLGAMIHVTIDPNFATEGDMSAEMQDLVHEGTFMRIGIRMVRDGGRITPVLENTQLYVDFLSQQNPEEVRSTDENLYLMGDVINSLRQTVRAGFSGRGDSEASDEEIGGTHRERAEEALRSFLALDEEYRRLGIDRPESYQRYIEAGEQTLSQPITKETAPAMKAVTRARSYFADYTALEEYVTYWGRDLLQEYMVIGAPAFLEGSKGVYADVGYDKLTAEVQQILDLIGLERTTQYGIETAQAMLRGIETTLREMTDDPTIWFASDEYRKFLEELASRLRAVAG
ncbi:MAG TPA: hypothetical protein VMB52_04530 [Verrucomicrobiae bacterium]|nr:hypothetical protein [Verrucomicrobiae bacterium]